ncbi:MAG: hypothetical protein ACO20H_09640 [Bacteriovoracaceae bacterium]
MRIILILLLLSSCISATKVTKNKFNHFLISGEDLQLDSFRPIDWRLFDSKETILHQGFQVKLKLPLISEGDLEKLAKSRGVDSYIIRVGHQIRGSSYIMGHMEIPFYRYLRSLRSEKVKGRKFIGVKKTHFQINYRAASLIPRSIHFVCPPLFHRLKIKQIRRKSFRRPVESFILGPLSESRLQDKPLKFLAQSAIFKGQRSLEGIYYFELALYDSQRKMAVSNFVRVPEYVEVLRESSIKLLECDNQDPGGKIYRGKPFKWIR